MFGRLMHRGAAHLDGALVFADELHRDAADHLIAGGSSSEDPAIESVP